MLPAMLKPVEKRALDLTADWPWLTSAHLGALMVLKRSRLSEVVVRLTALDLAAVTAVEGCRRLAATDRGLAMLARRDRASVGAARKLWSAAPIDADAPLEWRNVSGRRSRQLLRNIEHTAAVHGFIAALARQARRAPGRSSSSTRPAGHLNGLRIIESSSYRRGGIDVINVCLRKADVRDYERVSLDRLLNRINTSVKADRRYAHLIFDEEGEWMVGQLHDRLRERNPVPSKYEVWEDGAPTKDIPIERIIGGPFFRSSQDDDLLQMADIVAHALLKQEEEPSQSVKELGLHLAFGILDRVLNRKASRQDPQGVVRR